jgi:hypothetical protein
LTEEEKKIADDSNAIIKQLTNALLPVQKKLKFSIIAILFLKAQGKPLLGGDERQNLYTTLKDNKSQRKMNCICIQLTGYLKLVVTLTNWAIGDWNSPGIRTYRG